MSRHAFTLVELLVVIAIIGLLSTVAVLSLNTSRIKARNLKRNTDIEQISRAFYLAYHNAGSYPTGNWSCISSVCGGGWSGLVDDPVTTAFFVPTYIKSKPIDPLGGNRSYSGYLYIDNWNGTAPYDGYAFPTGAYLDWMLETTPGVSCGRGHIYESVAAYTSCLLMLEK